jgi:hypothetical protein
MTQFWAIQTNRVFARSDGRDSPGKPIRPAQAEEPEPASSALSVELGNNHASANPSGVRESESPDRGRLIVIESIDRTANHVSRPTLAIERRPAMWYRRGHGDAT